MADNVTLPGTGAVVASDDVSGVQYQIIKIAIGSDGSATLLPGDGTNGVKVDVTRLPVDGTTGANAKLMLRGYDFNASTYVDLAVLDNGGYGVIPVIVSNATQVYGDIKELSGYIVDAYAGEVQVKLASISAASSGDNTIVAAVADKKIRVLACVLSASNQVNAYFRSGTAGDQKSGIMYMAQYGGAVRDHNPHGWFETDAGDALVLNLSGAVAVGGEITYIEV